MVPGSLKIPMPFEYAFPHGALFRGVQAAVDFDKRGKVDDDQARDKDTGERIWTVTLLDLDPQAARFGRDLVKVKVIAPHQPVVPESRVPGYPPTDPLRPSLRGSAGNVRVDDSGAWLRIQGRGWHG